MVNGSTRKLKMDEETEKEFEKVWAKIREIEETGITKDAPVGREIERKKSLRELFLEFILKNDSEKTLFVMHGREELDGLLEFSTKDIKEGFQEIREKIPQNIADKFQTLHRAGFIMSANKSDNKKIKQKIWQLTNSGITFLKRKNKKHNNKDD